MQIGGIANQWRNNIMAWIKYKENCVINSDRILDIGIAVRTVYPKGNPEWLIRFHDGDKNQFLIGPFDSREECENNFKYLIGSLSNGMSYIDFANVPQNRIPMNEKYLLGKGFLKEVDEDLALEGFVTPNERIIVGSHRPYKTFPYDWFVIVKNQSMNDNIGSLDFAYVDQFETFLKLCGVDYEGK